MLIQRKDEAIQELNRLGLNDYISRVELLPEDTATVQPQHIEDWMVRKTGPTTMAEKRQIKFARRMTDGEYDNDKNHAYCFG